MSEIITYNSIPQLDGWGGANYWNCLQWVEWHKANVTELGHEAANQKFIYWWSQQHWDASPYNWCKYNSEFYNYFNNQGIDTGWLLSKVFVAIDEVGDALPDLSKTIKTTASIGRYILPVALIGFVLYKLYKYAK